MMRCRLRANTRSSAGEMSRSGVVKPGTSALVESTRKTSTPASPSLAKARRSVSRPSSGNWSILKSPVCSSSPRRCPDRDRQRVGDGMVHRDELELERPDARALTVLHHFAASAADAVLPDLPLQQRQGEFRPEQRDVGPLPQQIRDRTDVVLVPVGQHQTDHIAQPVGDRVEARQDEVDTRMVVLGEQHAAIDQQQLAVVLQDRHVAPDVTQSPQRDDAHPTRRQRRWCSKSTGSHADTLLSHMFLRPRASVLALASSIGRSWSPDSLCSDQLLLLAAAGQDEAADTLPGERR